jgi:hypothetical protein
MIPAFNLKEVRMELNRTFREYPNIKNRMIGFLFARPKSSLAKSQIIPNLEYFHHRSGNNIDFFRAGYGKYWEGIRSEIPDQIAVTFESQINWLFSNLKFNEFRREIEKNTSWNYSGSSDLILCNAYLNSNQDSVINFSQVYCCDLEKMINNQVILSIERYFEGIFNYAENPNEINPIAGFVSVQDNRGVTNIGKVVISGLLKKTSGIKLDGLISNFIRDVSKK